MPLVCRCATRGRCLGRVGSRSPPWPVGLRVPACPRCRATAKRNARSACSKSFGRSLSTGCWYRSLFTGSLLANGTTDMTACMHEQESKPLDSQLCCLIRCRVLSPPCSVVWCEVGDTALSTCCPRYVKGGDKTLPQVAPRRKVQSLLLPTPPCYCN